MKFCFSSGVMLLAITLTACSGGGGETAPAAAAAPQYPAAQQQFFALNKACEDSYGKGQNEIQKSLAFNECNKQRTDFAAQNGISGWTGTIKSISTDQGADVVSVEIEAEIDGFEMTFGTVNNGFSDMNTNSMITPDNPLFNVLAQMKEGEKITFDATFLQDPEGKRGVWEGSMTEQGSMSDPVFNVKFSDIRPFGTTPAVTSAQDAPKPANTQAVASEAAVDPNSVPSADEQYCGNMYRNLTPADFNDDAVAKFESECPGYDMPIQWADVSLRKAMREEEVKPSFDCAKASTQSEQLICSDGALANLDHTLAGVYTAARSRVPDKAGLKDAQNKWRREVRDACGDVACMKGAYEDRIAHLQEL